MSFWPRLASVAPICHAFCPFPSMALTFQLCKPQIGLAFKCFQLDKLINNSLRTSWDEQASASQRRSLARRSLRIRSNSASSLPC